MDQTVGKCQEQSRTQTNIYHSLQKSQIESQDQEKKPTIRSEMSRRWRIHLPFLVSVAGIEEQRGFLKLEDEDS